MKTVQWSHEVATESLPKVILCRMKSCWDKGEVDETERRASRKGFMSRHHYEVATLKENKSGYNIFLRS